MVLDWIRRYDEWIRERPERVIPQGVLLGIAFILVGLVTHGYIVAFGILVIVLVTPGVYFRQKLQNWIRTRAQPRKEPQSSEEDK